MRHLYEQYYTLREQRLVLQRQADALEQKEKDILYEITKDWDQPEYTGQEGAFHLKGVGKDVPNVVDWVATLTFIKQTGQIDLLQKRLTESAVKARWDSGVDIPGVIPVRKYTVTITKG